MQVQRQLCAVNHLGKGGNSDDHIGDSHVREVRINRPVKLGLGNMPCGSFSGTFCFSRPQVSSGIHPRWFPIQPPGLLQVSWMDASPYCVGEAQG